MPIQDTSQNQKVSASPTAAAHQVIHIQVQAPIKPEVGQACNGCGVCCLAEPCPLGMLLSGRRKGACSALRWVDEVGQYRCGTLVDAAAVSRGALPRWLHWGVPLVAWVLQRMARRWIAAGQGCDSTLELERPSTTTIAPDT